MSRDFRNLDFSFIYQCAPVIAGLKISNLLIINHNHISSVLELIHEFGLCFYLLYETKERSVLYVYNKKLSESYLENSDTLVFLNKLGYYDISIDDILKKISIKYSNYMHNKSFFPDELGIMLGYPIEDVEGYIKNNGKNYIYNGYWKVYSDADKKLKLFQSFDTITEKMIRTLIFKQDISFLLDNYKAV